MISTNVWKIVNGAVTKLKKKGHRVITLEMIKDNLSYELQERSIINVLRLWQRAGFIKIKKIKGKIAIIIK
ncbi:hypothetical protein DRN69_05415 [Candidatus Pacearchaeota archaeon]|nr:MAG: hypothetical protein DRN69_05415 [Candidatus Pacearchaeota archaeon]